MTDREIREYNSRVEFREWWEIQAVKIINAATRPVHVWIWIFFILDCLLGAFALQRFTGISYTLCGLIVINWLVGFGITAFFLWMVLLLLSLIYWIRMRDML